MKSKIAVLAASCAAALAAPAPAIAQTQDRFLGEIITVGMNFCPRGTAEAAGQLLAISQNTALFSLFGTIYGGDGRTTFALPDLRGRSPMGAGRGPGMEPVRQGTKLGAGPAATTADGSDHLTTQTGTPRLALKYCVVTNGVFPSRS